MSMLISFCDLCDTLITAQNEHVLTPEDKGKLRDLLRNEGGGRGGLNPPVSMVTTLCASCGDSVSSLLSLERRLRVMKDELRDKIESLISILRWKEEERRLMAEREEEQDPLQLQEEQSIKEEVHDGRYLIDNRNEIGAEDADYEVADGEEEDCQFQVLQEGEDADLNDVTLPSTDAINQEDAYRVKDWANESGDEDSNDSISKSSSIEEQERFYFCEICQREFGSQQGLSMHKKHKHLNPKKKVMAKTKVSNNSSSSVLQEGEDSDLNHITLPSTEAINQEDEYTDKDLDLGNDFINKLSSIVGQEHEESVKNKNSSRNCQPPKRKQYFCEICKREFLTSQAFSMHKKHKHLNSEKKARIKVSNQSSSAVLQEGEVIADLNDVTMTSADVKTQDEYRVKDLGNENESGDENQNSNDSISKLSSIEEQEQAKSARSKNNRFQYPKREYFCEICQREFQAQKGLSMHMKHKHLNPKKKVMAKTKVSNNSSSSVIQEGEDIDFNDVSLPSTDGKIQDEDTMKEVGSEIWDEDENSNDSISKSPSIQEEKSKHSRNCQPPKRKQYFCEVCQREFLTSQAFSMHKKYKHLYPKKKARTEFSNESSPSVRSRSRTSRALRMHEHLIHRGHIPDSPALSTLSSEGPPFLCFCAKSYEDKPHRDFHYQVSHPGKNQTKCEPCGMQFRNQPSLQNHFESFSHRRKIMEVVGLEELPDEEFKHQCEICGKGFYSNQSYLYHKGSAHINPASAEICETCGKQFSTKQTLSQHMKSHLLPNICESCGRRFAHLWQLRSHNLHAHEPHKLPIKKCPHCPKMCRGVISFKQHILNIHEPHKRPIKKCPHCPKTFRARESFRRHILNIHEHHKLHDPNKLPTKKCPHCPKTFTALQAFRRHILYIHEPHKLPLRKCPHCPKTFKTLHFFKQHILYHETNKLPLKKCPHCPETFKALESFKKHILIHEPQVHLKKCSYCETTFTSVEAFNRHMLDHKNEARSIRKSFVNLYHNLT